MRTVLKFEESTGYLVFTFAERQDRLYARPNKKIERLDRRVTLLEERGRS